MSTVLGKHSSGGKQRKLPWLPVVAGMKQWPKTLKAVSIIIPFVRLAQKALLSVSGKSEKELRLKNFRILLMVRIV